jgi:hypothetical protein
MRIMRYRERDEKIIPKLAWRQGVCMMRSLYENKKSRNSILGMLCVALLLLATSSHVQAAAPARAKPYAESRCNTDSNIFFCEDFEGEDIRNYGSNNCNSTWGNPAIQQKDICWAGGGSYQYNTTSLPGFNSNNRVWRVSKSQSFKDVVTGISTGTGPGTIAGWLKSSILGSGAREWYTRIQVYFSSNHSFPADYDFKMFVSLPGNFVDPPSAAWDQGIFFHQDFFCSGVGNFNDVPVMRYGKQFDVFPFQNDYCPPLTPGQAADGRHAPRLQKGRWYTLESHVKLASSSTTNDGILELWVDGVRAYSTQRNNCQNGCPDLGYIMILGWMNSADSQTGYYEIDNVVMSRSYIGPPSGWASPSPDNPPAAPGSLSIN